MNGKLIDEFTTNCVYYTVTEKQNSLDITEITNDISP